jgi:tRNA(fMet)-specific endonuclease VapC
MRYLIDTDWIIHYLNGNEGIIKKINSLREEGLGISIISLSEIYEGIYYSSDPLSNEKALEDFLSGVSILNINYGICKIFGKERGRLRRKGILISDFDLLIASTCLYYDLTLLTNNVRHFERVENLKILSSEG